MKDFKFYIFAASALLIVYLVAEYNRPKPINWAETYVNADKIPFGTYILYHQLNDIFPDADVKAYKAPVYNVLTDNTIDHGTYLIICKQVSFTEYDYAKLVQFIKKGNDVFIASETFGTYLTKQLKIETTSRFTLNKTPNGLRFVNKTQDTGRVYKMNKSIGTNYFDHLDTARAIVLGKDANNDVNFIKYSFSKGSLYLNSNPLMFTNYSLLHGDGAAYASTALSNLKNNSNIIWDEFFTTGKAGDESPMRVFLRNPPLRAAYYIALFGLILFVVYQIKRRQRIIPIIEPLQNSTLDFVNVVGQVYYEQRNNSNIATKKVSYFLEHLRTKYNLKTNILNEEFTTALAHKSGVDTTLIQQLMYQVTLTRSGAAVNDNELIALNKNIEQFYLQAR